jgi:hypothetical protein
MARTTHLHASLVAAARCLAKAQEHLTEAAAAADCHLVNALLAAVVDLHADVLTDCTKHAPVEHNAHILAFEQQPKPVFVPVAAQITEPAPVATPKPAKPSYRELQTQCKKAGLSAKGKATELVERLAAHKQTYATQPTTPKPAPTPLPTRITDEAERASLLAILATLSTQELRDLVALSAMPATEAA